MRKIELTQGKFAIVDDEDYEYLRQFKWYYREGYAARGIRKPNGKWTTIYMHRVIMGASECMEVDHINGDKSDNRKENLRICTLLENRRNRTKYKSNTTGYKGVYYDRRKIRAKIKTDNKQIYLGSFKTLKEAAKAYNEAALKYHGEYARLNKVA